MKRPKPLGTPLKNQPAFGYHQAMYRAAFTLLVGLMLSVSGGAWSVSAFASSHNQCGEVSLADFNWASAEIMANVDKLILSAAFGCRVKLIPGATMTTFASMVERSSPDVAGEVWTNAFRQKLIDEVQSSNLTIANEQPISQLGEGWWVSPSILQMHPNLITLEDILERPDLFPHPNITGKGAFHGCPPGWGCSVANKQLFKAFKMKEKGWLLVEPSSAADLDSSIARVIDSQQNWFGYYWSPTATVGYYDLRPVDFGVPWGGAKNWDNCILNIQCDNPRPTSWTHNGVATLLTTEFKNRERNASDYFMTRYFPGEVMNELLVYMADGHSAEETARKFLDDYQGIWQNWLPPNYLVTASIELGISLPKTDSMLSGGKSNKFTDNKSASSTNTQADAPTSAELLAAQRKAEELERRLADLEAQQQQQQKTISGDTQAPLITITQSGTDQRKGAIMGFALDNVEIAELLVDGVAVNVGSDGSFEWSGYVPATGKDITIEAIDTAALSSTKIVRLERGQVEQASGPRFDDLDPTAGGRVVRNENALALIVGIADYKRTDAPAIYADKDAQYFHDYSSLKLGIPDSNIMTMVNDKAELGDVILAVKDWMRRSSKPSKSDVYVFFAGHGLASQDGEQMYLLPFDGRPRLLDKTAILRDELFDDIAAANPRSVTVFLDTCYSGTTRGADMLIASRPIAIKALKKAVPENFTVMTAAAGDQTAKPLEEAKHGMFSYFLMKGMEGDADANQDNQITAGELHAYVQQNVIQQSSGSQTPELQGDRDRVLVKFQ